MDKEYNISEKEFLEIRNALSLLSIYGIHAVCIREGKYEDLQERIKWGWGKESEYLSDVRLVKV
jgi:hypothetical protein